MDSSVENKVSKNMEKKKSLAGEHDFKSVAASYLITVDWNSIRLSSSSLPPQYLRAADEGTGLLKFGPFGNPTLSQRLG